MAVLGVSDLLDGTTRGRYQVVMVVPQVRRSPAGLRPSSLVVHVVLLLGAAISLAFAVGLLLWVGVGRPGLANGGPLDAKDRFEGVKLVLAVVGGVGAVVALTIAYRRQRHSEAAEYREDLKLFTDRFGKAAEQLGSHHPATRLAGVYAMTRTADDAHDFDSKQLCIDVLCGYLRLPCEPDPADPEHRYADHVVRHTILRVIRDHLRPGFSTVSWCGHNFRLNGAVLDGLDFTGIHLTGGHMTFHGARMVSGTNYFSATVNGGSLWFTSTRFDGGELRFKGARFLSGRVSFKGAIFSGGTITFREVVHNPQLQLDFTSAQFHGATFDWGTLPIPINAPSQVVAAPASVDSAISDA